MLDYTVTAAAAYLGVTPQYVRWLIMQGRLTRGQRIDRRTYLITASSLATFKAGWTKQRKLTPTLTPALLPAGKEAA